MNITRRAFLAGGAATTAVIAGQLSHPSPSVAQANKVVNLYSARHYDTDNAIYTGFTKQTGIKVNLIEADADKLIERIKSEGANSPADVLITVDAGRLWRAQDAGLFQPVDSAVLKRNVPANMREPGGLWFGLTRRVRFLVYNKDKVKPSDLSTYEDLASPKWSKRLLSRTSTHVYNQSLTGSIVAARGEQVAETWAKGIAANFARKPEGNDTAQIKAVAAGVGDVTFVNNYYVARLMKSSKPEDKEVASKIGVFFPNQADRGAHVNICGAGVAKNAPNRDAAIKLIEYLTSREAQEIFAKSNNEYPVLDGVAIDPVVASFGKFKGDQVNAAVLGRNNPVALQLMDRAGWA
jgi:iron(III) transport system substrate-binding protein